MKLLVTSEQGLPQGKLVNAYLLRWEEGRILILDLKVQDAAVLDFFHEMRLQEVTSMKLHCVVVHREHKFEVLALLGVLNEGLVDLVTRSLQEKHVAGLPVDEVIGYHGPNVHPILRELVCHP